MFAAFLLVAVASSSMTFAQSPPANREVKLVAKPGELDILRTVATPAASSAVVSDAGGVLAVALKPVALSNKQKQAGQKQQNGPHIALYKLDAQGEIASTSPALITLPRSKKFPVERQCAALSLVAHPKLPLLYVWQDALPLTKNDGPDAAPPDDHAHLQVYDLASAEPALVQSTAQGETYASGIWAGAIAFDLTASRLFVPNMQRRTTTTVVPAIGYLRVADDGAVIPNEEEAAAAVAVGGKGTTADRSGSVSLAARKAYLEQIRTGKVLDRVVRYATSATSTFAGFPAGLGFFNVSDDVTLVAGPLGPVTWDEANRRAQFNSVVFYPVVGIGYQYRMIGHPKLPVVFLTGLTSDRLYRMEHVDGFLTMLPQRALLGGATAITSPPVLLGDRPLLACGSANLLHLIGFDIAGLFNGERTDVPVANSTVEAIAYSPKFDRLYVAVEEGAKK
jgi:hypothetical protein